MRKAPAVSPIVLTLPECPSENTYYRRSGTHMHVSNEARAYREAVRMLTGKYRSGTQCTFPSGDLRMDVTWHRSRRAGDLGNRRKILEDALQGTIYSNDKQIAQGWSERVDAHPEIPPGYMRVTIMRVGDTFERENPQ